MNARIKELSDKCGLAWTLKTEQDVKNLAEFAELVAKDCLNIAKEVRDAFDDATTLPINIESPIHLARYQEAAVAAGMVVNMISDKFGVEE